MNICKIRMSINFCILYQYYQLYLWKFSYLMGFLLLKILQDLTGGEFEKNLASLNLKEGVDFYHFN